MRSHCIIIALNMCFLLVACSDHGSGADRPVGQGAREWTLNERHTYDLKLQSQYGAAKTTPVVEVALAATIELTAIRREGPVLEFLITLADPKLIARQSGSAMAGLAQIATELQRPYIFTLSSGRFSTNRFARGTNPLVVGIMRTLSAALQRVGDTGGSERWEATENDSAGAYVAAYERASLSLLRKHKLRYESWNSTAKAPSKVVGGMPLPRVSDSTIEVHGVEAAPERVAMSEVLDTVLGPATSLQATTSLSLTRRQSEHVAVSVRDRSAIYASTVESAASAPLAITVAPDLDRAKIGNLSFPQIVAGLEGLAGRRSAAKAKYGTDHTALAEHERVTGAAWMEQETKLFAALNATLRQTPEVTSQVERLIRSDSAARNVLISGLGAAGIAEGHQILLTLMADMRVPEDLRNACGLSLMRTPKVSAVAVHGVEARLDDPDWHRLAVYGLGTYARLLRDGGEVEESKRLVGVLVSRFRVARKVAEKVDLLFGLSNSGSPDVLELVRGGLISDRNKDVRGAAVSALRLIGGQDAERMLVETLAGDLDRHVRLDALRTLTRREPSEPIVRALAQASLHDESDRVRYEAVGLMTTFLPKVPTLRSTLEQVSRSDSEETIRTFAAAALTTPTPGNEHATIE